MPRLEDYASSQPQPNSDGFGDKVWRELSLAGHGFKAVPNAFVESITERPVETGAKFLLAAGVGGALSYMSMKPGLRGIARSAAGGLGVPMIGDLMSNIGPTAGAFVDNWKSDANWDANVFTVEKKFAPFFVDSAWAMVGGAAGGYAGLRTRETFNPKWEPMLPELTDKGFLPPGVHKASWQEFATTYGGSPRRQLLLNNMEYLLREAKAAGGEKVYVGGSFVSNKANPGDFEMTWKIDGPKVGELYKTHELTVNRTMQEQKLGGQLMVTYPGSPGGGVLGFLQQNRRYGIPVGVVELDLSTLPSNASYKVRSWFGKTGIKPIPELPKD